MLKSQFVLPFGLGSILAIALVGGAIFVGPLLTPNQSFLCPGVVGDPTSFQGVGFVTSKPTRFLNGMQFVIKPNSTAFVQTSHYVPSNSENRSEEHTSELQSQSNLVCRLLLEKKKTHP